MVTGFGTLAERSFLVFAHDLEDPTRRQRDTTISRFITSAWLLAYFCLVRVVAALLLVGAVTSVSVSSASMSWNCTRDSMIFSS